MAASDDPEIAGLLRFFPTRERLDSFMAGDLYLNTPHVYRRLEQIGAGDDFDACVAFYSASKHPRPPRIVVDEKQWDLSRASEVLIYLEEDRFDAHLQCWFVLPKPESEEELLSIQSDLARVKNEFGSYHVLLPAENVTSYLRLVWDAAKSPLRAEVVTYAEERLRGAMFVKRTSYSYQREYRVAVGRIKKGAAEPRHLRVGSLANLVHPNPYIKISVDQEETMLLTPHWHDTR